MIILTIMIVPISSRLPRAVHTVPQDLKEGAFGLGLTRWEMVRGVILPVHARRRRRGDPARPRPRARRGDRRHTGDRHGDASPRPVLRLGDTLASRIATQYQGAATHLESSSLFYLALILLILRWS